jgi:hypothetical protein
MESRLQPAETVPAKTPRPTQKDTSTGPSVKSVSHHKSASGLAHSTTLTRFTQPRALSQPLGRTCPPIRVPWTHAEPRSSRRRSTVPFAPASWSARVRSRFGTRPTDATDRRQTHDRSPSRPPTLPRHPWHPWLSQHAVGDEVTRLKPPPPTAGEPQGTRPPATRKLSGSAGYGVPASAGGNRPSQNTPAHPKGHVHRPFSEIRVSPQKRERTRALHDAHALHSTAGNHKGHVRQRPGN